MVDCYGAWWMRGVTRTGLAALPVALALLVAPAAAQDVNADSAAARWPAATDAASLDHSSGDDVAAVTPPATIDETSLARALQYDPLSISSAQRHALRIPWQSPKPADWSRDNRADGSAKISVTKPITAPWDMTWDAAIGGDLSLPSGQMTTFGPGTPLPGTAKADTGRGGAWARLNVPHVAGIELRVDPSLDGSTVGANLRRTVPVGSNYSVTLNNRVSVTDPFGSPVSSPSPGATSQIWNNEKAVELNILSTGTSLGVSAASSTASNVTHHSLSAQQQLYGPLQITTTVTDPGQPTASQSVTAGFKLKW